MPTTQESIKALSRNEALQELFNLREKAATKKHRIRHLNAEDFSNNDYSESSFASMDSKPWLEDDYR